MRVRVWAALVLLLTTAAVAITPGISADGPTISIDSPSEGGTIAELATVAGTVGGATPVTHVRYRVDDGVFAAVDSFDGTAWSTAIDTTVLTNGAHTIEISARDEGGMSSTASVGVVVANANIFDVGVASFAASGVTPVFEVVAENEGAEPMTGVVAAFDYMDHFEWIPIGTTTFDVAALGETTFTFAWDDELFAGEFPVRVTLDADGAYPEQDESDNQAEGVATFYVPVLEGTDPLYPLQDDPVPTNAKIVSIEGTGATAAFTSPVHVIRVRDVMIWVNSDMGNEVLHSAVADDGSFDTGLIERGWHSDIYSFDEPGTYTYHCGVHPNTMKGVLVVVGNDVL